MPRFARLDVLNTFVSTNLVPIFYNADPEVAKKVAWSISTGSCRLLEFTNRGDFAPEIFKELSRYCQRELPDLILGAGSILDAPTAALYVSYGANFIVGPYMNPEVARYCNRHKISYSPGCGSATEIGDAEELGVEIVKMFPGDSVGGPAFIKAILGPCPWTRIMPTGGVRATRENLTTWFKAGATAVGIGGDLIRKEYLASGDFDALAARTAETMALVREIRGSLS